MILDEPSNHLDLEATEWLEGFLLESSAAMIVVSHDRYFLDKVTNRTLELFDGTVDAYAGNFSAYWRQKHAAAAGPAADLREAADRDREDQGLHPPQRLRPEARPGRGPAEEAGADRAGGPAAGDRRAADAVSGGRPLRATSWSGPRGWPRASTAPLFARSRWTSPAASAGPCWGPTARARRRCCGACWACCRPTRGKSTSDQAWRPDTSTSNWPSCRTTRPWSTPCGRKTSCSSEQQRRNLLARFGLTGQRALQKVGELSGGERCRAALARLAAREANFLVLDEPTNHLDLWARDALEKALAALRRDRAAGEPRPLLRQPRGRPRGDDRARSGSASSRETTTPTRCWPAGRASDAAEATAAGRPPAAAERRGGEEGRREKPARKRRFPFRKLADLEDEISNAR